MRFHSVLKSTDLVDIGPSTLISVCRALEWSTAMTVVAEKPIMNHGTRRPGQVARFDQSAEPRAGGIVAAEAGWPGLRYPLAPRRR